MYSEAEDVTNVISSLANAPSAPAFDPTVARIQDALNKFLYTDAHARPLKRDGQWGIDTQAAMQKFMNSKQINSVQDAISVLFNQSPPKQHTKNPLLVNPWESE
jgi:Zn-dependent oligopeptidase